MIGSHGAPLWEQMEATPTPVEADRGRADAHLAQAASSAGSGERDPAPDAPLLPKCFHLPG